MSEPRTDRDDVLDALYEGGDEARLDESARGELARWREVRGLVREGRADEEPAGSLGVLMAAARQHAEQRAPRGLWGKLRSWFAVMVAHPAASAAATIVVVAGVAGTLYVRGRVTNDSGTVGEHAPPRAAETEATTPKTDLPPIVAEPGPTSGAAAAGSASGSAAGSGSAVAAVDDERREISPEIPAEKIEPAKEPPAHHAPPARPKGGASGSGSAVGFGAGQADHDGIVDDDFAAHEGAPGAGDQQIARGEQTQGFAGAPGGGKAPTTKPAPTPSKAEPPPPPPPPPPVVVNGADAGDSLAAAPAADEDRPATTQKPPAAAPQPAPAAPAKKKVSPTPADLLRQAKVAARQKDCKTVDAIAGRVITLDEGYYRATFATDPDIRDNCAAATKK